MTITGKSALSLAKEEVMNQKVPAIGFKKLVFAHQAAAGETGISLASLNTPSSYSGKGFVQPDYEEMVRASLLFFRKNLTIISTARGVLLDYDSYQVASNTQINFTDDFGTALDDEIFIGIVDPVVKTGNLIADVEFILETGTLDAGDTDINIGKSFSTNMNPTKQMGAVMVVVGGNPQFRNVGNATASPTADGNYEEVDNGAGRSTVIRMNSSSTSDRVYQVISTATTVIRPDGSVMDELEKQQGVVDKLVETTAVLAGVPETDFQSAPTQPQLNQFGDRLVELEKVFDVEVPYMTEWVSFVPTGSWTANTTYTGFWRRVGDNVELDIKVAASGAPTATALIVDLPSGLVIDTSKLSSIAGAADPFGMAWANDSATLYGGRITYEDTTSVRPRLFNDNGNFEALTSISHNSPFTVGSGDFVVLRYSVPIVGWEAKAKISDLI